MKKIISAQLKAAEKLRDETEKLNFKNPVVCVYNPLNYAWGAFEEYVERFGSSHKRSVFLGMNPGPWGMAQTGVPFGEVEIVREWLKITASTGRPADEHPQYPVEGLNCKRSEVSGKRLWGLFRDKFGTPEAFFKEHFVLNYCPLLFIASSIRKNGTEGGRNLTPDKLTAEERLDLYRACDSHLCSVIEALKPLYLIGIGAFAETRAKEALNGMDITISRILHPSSASPLSNADWPGTVTRQLITSGVW